MKKTLMLLLFLPTFTYSQVKVSEMTSASSVEDADYFYIVKSGNSRKVPYSVFKWGETEVAGQISDSLDLLRTDISNEISDSIQAISVGTSVSFGNGYEIPYTNAATDDFDYSSDFAWNGTYLTVNKGTNNIFIGNASGSNTTGYDNTFIGYTSGYSNIIGNYNTFIGSSSGYSNTGSSNTFNGYKSGWLNTSGSSNTFIGNASGSSNTTGSYNTFVGSNTGESTTTGAYNTFIGYSAGASNTTGNNNVFIGRENGDANISGYNNTHIGNWAGHQNTTGYQNTLIGVQSGYFNTTGYQNTFIGTNSAYSNTTGILNTFLGYYSGKSNTTGNNSLILGAYAGYNGMTGGNNTYLGAYAGYTGTTNTGNVFIGYQSGQSETGSNKLYIENSSSTSPLIYGDFENDTVRINGNLNVNSSFFKVGDNLLFTNDTLNIYKNITSTTDTTKINGVFQVGSNFEWNDTTLNIGQLGHASSLFIGDKSGESNTGNYNSFLGWSSGYKNTSGAWNTIIGASAAGNMLTGDYNVIIGYGAGSAIVAGDRNVLIGSNVKNITDASDKLYIDNSNTANPLIYGDFATNTLTINDTLSVTGAIKGVESVAKAEILYTNTAQTTIITLPANAVVWNIGIEVVTLFDDSGTDLLDIGITGTGDRYVNNYALSGGAGFITYNYLGDGGGSYTQDAERFTTSTNITFQYTGQNSDATQGQAFVYIHYTIF